MHAARNRPAAEKDSWDSDGGMADIYGIDEVLKYTSTSCISASVYPLICTHLYNRTSTHQ